MTLEKYLEHNQVHSVSDLTDKAVIKYVCDGHAGRINQITLSEIQTHVLGLDVPRSEYVPMFRKAIEQGKALYLSYIFNEGVVGSDGIHTFHVDKEYELKLV